MSMTRDQIVTHFIELSGRYDLVTNAIGGDYSNASPMGADFFINGGVKWLENRVERRKEFLWERVDIAVGQVLQTVRNVKSFKEVWMMNVDGRAILSKKSVGWLRENYGAASGIDNDKPKFWAPVPVGFSSNSRQLGPELVINGEFYDELSWTTGGNWVIASGKADITTAATSTMFQTQTVVIGTTYRVEYTISNVTAGTVAVTLGSKAGATRSTNGTFVEDIVPTGTSQLSFAASSAFLGSIDNVSIKEVLSTGFSDFTFDLDDVVYGDTFDIGAIMWMPPADTVYTLSILAHFRERSLINSSDKNFWSDQFEEILITASLMMLERFYRNTEGVNDYKRELTDDLRTVGFEVIEEEISGINQMQG